MTAPTHSAPLENTLPTTTPTTGGFEDLLFEELRQALPLDDPDRHALENPSAESAFARLAADNPDRVSPRATGNHACTHTLDSIRAHDLNITLRRAAGSPVREYRITPQQWEQRTVFCVMAIGWSWREIPLPKGAAQAISVTLREAFPDALWSRAQNYTTANATLREHTPPVPSFLRRGGR